MKILITAASFLLTDTYGIGEGIVVYELAKRLIARGHHIIIISNESKVRDAEFTKYVKDLNIQLYPMISELREEIGWHYFTYKAYELARELVRENKVDIIHHMLPSYMGRYSLMYLLKKPFIYGPVSLEHRNIDFKTEFVKNYIPLSKQERSLVDDFEVISNREYITTLKNADKIIITLPVVKKGMPYEVKGKCAVIPLGVDDNTFIPTERKTKNMVLSVGAMTKIKGFDYLITAMKDVLKYIKDASLVLVGEGPDLNYFHSIVKKNGLGENIKFLRNIPHTKISTIFQECAVYCQPSLSETFGLARLEAMASGKPVIYSASGAGENGFISNPGLGGEIPPRNPQLLASEIVRFLKDDKLRKRAGEANRKLIEDQYSWDAIIDEYEKLYNNLV